MRRDNVTIRLAGGRRVPDVRELRTIRRAVELARMKGASLREVGRLLEKDGLLPKGRGEWHPQQVARIISYSRPDGLYRRLGLRLA